MTPRASYKYLIVSYSVEIAIDVARLLNIPSRMHIWVSDCSRLRGRNPPNYRIVVEFGWVYNKPQWTIRDREIDTYLTIWNIRYPQTIRTISLDQEHGVMNRAILQESEKPIWMVREHVPSSFRSVSDSRGVLSSPSLQTRKNQVRDPVLSFSHDSKDDS